MMRNSSGRASFVPLSFSTHVPTTLEAALGRERFHLLAGAYGVLLIRARSQVGSGVHGRNHSVVLNGFLLSVCFRLLYLLNQRE
jgi:hypothetical protein